MLMLVYIQILKVIITPPLPSLFETFDNIGPTMTITSTTSGVSDGSITNDSSISLTFTF